VLHQQEACIFQAWLVPCRVRMDVGSEPLLGSIGSPIALFAAKSEACPRTTSASIRGDVSEDACCCALRAAVGPQSTRKAAAQAMTTAHSPKLANARSRPANMQQSLREQLRSVLSAVPTYRFSGAFAVTGVARWKLSDLVPDGTGLATGW